MTPGDTQAPKRSGPSINKGKSRQDYETPWEVVRAVERMFGPMAWDLAASETNKKADRCFTEAQNSLRADLAWGQLANGGNLWLNPPYGVIGPWAEKASRETDWHDVRLSRVFMLVPASVGSNWFRDHVHRKALVLFLSPRIQFVGADDPYPKDLMLCCFGISPGYDCWNWAKGNP